MTNSSVSFRQTNSHAHRFTLKRQETLWLETAAAAAEGRCMAALTPEAYQRIKAQEQAVYRSPSERLDFWRGLEARLVQ